MQSGDSAGAVQMAFPNRIGCIQLLRIIAAICIALYHMFDWTAFGRHLYASVDLFYCITAFLAMYTTQNPDRAKGFICRRLVRILPLYWLITAFTYSAAQIVPSLGASQGSIGVKELVFSLLLIPYYRSGLKAAAVRPIVGPAWTLYCDLYFTFIFAASMKINHKYRGCISGAVCLVLAFARAVGTGCPFLSVLFTDHWFDFIAGILVFEILQKSGAPLARHSKPAEHMMTLLAMAGLLVLYFVPTVQPVTGMLCLVVLLLSIIGTKDHHFSKTSEFLGNLTYSFYLIHYYFIIILSKFVDWNRINGMSISAAVIVILAAAFAAFIAYRIVELKAGSFLKNILSGLIIK